MVAVRAWFVVLALVGCSAVDGVGERSKRGPDRTAEGSTDQPYVAAARIPWVHQWPNQPGTGGTSTTLPEEEASDVWIARTVMARLADGVSAAQLAKELGAAVTEPSDSGYIAIEVPDGTRSADYLEVLRDHPMVVCVSRMSYVSGAGWTDEMRYRSHPGQWHLVAARAPLSSMTRVDDRVVAVLDSGVAYEEYDDGVFTYVPAPSLAGSSIVAPYDFIHRDTHANDDHQHGTHIASLIASRGTYEGVAAGVGLMPVKVLDQTNRGSELALIDGISHATRHGADVINMSLSFPVGYVPSPALREVLQNAHDAGIVMVAAAGNQGSRQVTWPAASRLVIAVGATHPSLPGGSGVDWDVADNTLATYSNHSNAVDVLAPGGDLTVDRTGDGIVDGMLAETILPGDPSKTAPWLYAGTSQAAAVVSGAVVHLLQWGAAPRDVPHLLHMGAGTQGLWQRPFMDGIGAGSVMVDRSIQVGWLLDRRRVGAAVTAGVLPYLRATNEGILATARVWPRLDDADVPEQSIVVGTVLGPGGGVPVSCTIPPSATWCDLQSPPLADDVDGVIFQVDGVLIDGMLHRPTAAVFATEAAEVLLASVGTDASHAGAVPTFHFAGGPDPVLGDLLESYVFHNLGTGLLSSPLGIVLRPRGLRRAAVAVDVSLDGSGLLSSPLGMMPARWLDVGGGSLVSFDAAQVQRSALGLHPSQFFGAEGPAGKGLLSSPLGFTGDQIDLGRGTSAVDLVDTHFGGWVGTGGFLLASGDEPGRSLVGSGAVSVPVDDLLEGSGAGSASVPDPGP